MSAATYSRVVGSRVVAKVNPCHKPAGSSEGGQFCETGGGTNYRMWDVSELQEQNRTWDKKLTQEERAELEAYTGYGFQVINERLRKAKGKELDTHRLRERVALLDAAVGKNILD